jgi:hypothetical protein
MTEINHQEDQDVEGCVILKWILELLDVEVLNEFVSLRLRRNGGMISRNIGLLDVFHGPEF